MDQKGLRGSASARIDEKGRLKVPTIFRGLVHAQAGPDVFVTSLTSECVRIYPMDVWLATEQKVLEMPGNHPSRLKFQQRRLSPRSARLLQHPLLSLWSRRSPASLLQKN